MKKRRGSCLAVICPVIAIVLFLIVFLASQPNYLRYLWNLREGRKIPDDIDLGPLKGGLWHGEPLIRSDPEYLDIAEIWNYLDNRKLKNWRERPYILFFRGGEELIFKGAEMIESPVSLDVYWRIDEPSPGATVPMYDSKKKYASEKIITALGVKRREKLPGVYHGQPEYRCRFVFYFSTASGDIVSADSSVLFDIEN